MTTAPGLVVAFVVAVSTLAGCSVPREADLPTANVAADAATPSPAGPSPTGGATPSPLSPALTLAPPPSPSPAQVRAPTPVTVPGYTLVRAPASVGNPLSGVKGAADVFGAQTVRSVRKGDTPVGLLFLFAVRPQYAQDPAVAAVVLPRVTAGISRGGVPATMTRFGRQRVAVASSSSKGTIVVWLRNGDLAVVCGAESDPATGYARAYIAAS
ncbi:MAG TPA: hypothetical protein VMT69_08845 [Kineosporiaceae bacterium]|nr:hypothetical protein [Kineosporiaceae bacterium]